MIYHWWMVVCRKYMCTQHVQKTQELHCEKRKTDGWALTLGSILDQPAWSSYPYPWVVSQLKAIHVLISHCLHYPTPSLHLPIKLLTRNMIYLWVIFLVLLRSMFTQNTGKKFGSRLLCLFRLPPLKLLCWVTSVGNESGAINNRCPVGISKMRSVLCGWKYPAISSLLWIFFSYVNSHKFAINDRFQQTV